MLPAVGQGALALECTADSPHRPLLESLEHRPTRVTIDAERAFLERLEGGCTVPLAAHAILDGDSLWVRGLVGAPDGSEVVRAERRGPASRARAMGQDLAEELLRRGARALLDAHAGARSVSEHRQRLAGVRVLVPPRESAPSRSASSSRTRARRCSPSRCSSWSRPATRDPSGPRRSSCAASAGWPSPASAG
jgi:hypothetical protein